MGLRDVPVKPREGKPFYEQTCKDIEKFEDDHSTKDDDEVVE